MVHMNLLLRTAERQKSVHKNSRRRHLSTRLELMRLVICSSLLHRNKRRRQREPLKSRRRRHTTRPGQIRLDQMVEE